MSAATASSLTEPHYVANIQILNKYRKDNLFSSINTWASVTQAPWQPRPGTWARTCGWLQPSADGGVNPVEEFRIVSAGRAMVSGMTAGFQNAKDHFLTGKQTFAARSLMEEAQREMGVNSGQALSALKAEQDAAINRICSADDTKPWQHRHITGGVLDLDERWQPQGGGRIDREEVWY